MRFIEGNPTQFAIMRWYRPPPTAKVFPFPHAFGSGNWDDTKKLDTDLGDDATQRQVYSKGLSLNSSDGTSFAGDANFFLVGAPAPAPLPRGPDGTPLSCGGLIPLGTVGKIAKFATANTVDDSSLTETTAKIASAKPLTLPGSSSLIASLSLAPANLPLIATLGDIGVDLTGRLVVSGNPVFDTANPPPTPPPFPHDENDTGYVATSAAYTTIFDVSSGGAEGFCGGFFAWDASGPAGRGFDLSVTYYNAWGENETVTNVAALAPFRSHNPLANAFGVGPNLGGSKYGPFTRIVFQARSRVAGLPVNLRVIHCLLG